MPELEPPGAGGALIQTRVSLVGIIALIDESDHSTVPLKTIGSPIVFSCVGLAKGHIWPEWLGKLLPTAAYHDQVVGEIHTLLIQGAHPILLDTISQRFLATFLCLITMRIEFTDFATIAVPAADRDWLRHNFEPPPRWRIWLARYDGPDPQSHFCRHYGMEQATSEDTSASQPPKCNTQVTTLVLGKLCAHMFSSEVMPAFEGYEGIRLSRIWPPNHYALDWQHVALIEDRAILFLAEALARETAGLTAVQTLPSRTR